MILGLIFAFVGLVVLALAADQFVKGAARLAVVLRIPPVLVGAVLVGFGTSAPEMVVSGLAAAEGRLGIGVGNIIGSNVANVSLVLGASALMGVVPVSREILLREGPISVASVVVFALLVQNELTRLDGLLLAALLTVWVVLTIRKARRSTDIEVTENLSELISDQALSAKMESLRVVMALTWVVASAYLLVDGAQRIADALNLTEGFVGYTLVAVGTSAPELVTAMAAARQGETELLVGNLLGSNLFNSLAVGGLIALVGPGLVDDVTLQTVGSLLMVLICLVSWGAMATGKRVTRYEGVALLGLWILSVALLAG